MIDPYPSLHQTVRVGLDPEHLPEWGGFGVATGIEHGIDVPHEAVNIPCNMVIGEWVLDGVHYPKRCRKRRGHETAKGTEPHVPVDMREKAWPAMVTHTQRFAPNLVPAGVDQNEVTIPHNCENHLPDTEEVLRRGW